MTVVFALLAALGNAVNVITQHVASTSDPEGSKGWRLVVYLFKNPLWLFGWVALIGAFVFQALALHTGQLSVVQTLLITELVFGLVLRRVWIRQDIGAAAWASAALTAVAVAVFLTVAEPRGGHLTPTSGAWLSSILGCGLAVGAAALLSLRGSPARRAALLAIASGIVWALEATFIKSMTDTLASDGIVGSLERWPIYGVAVGGIVGTLLTQAAIHVGPLRASQPFLVIVDPVVSIFLSVHLFDEYFTGGVGDLAIGSTAFVLMCAGVVLLTRTVPEDVQRPRAAAQPTSSG